MSRYTAIEPLTDRHDVDGFCSGEPSPDAWLATRARANQIEGCSRTYVTTDGKRVVGYHAVSSVSILRTHAPRRARKQAPLEIPAILLGRLAVDQEHRGQGLGAALLRHAMLVTVEASQAVGVRLLVVNAVHDQAAAFYRRFGFHSSPTNPLDLMTSVQEIEDAL